MFFIHRFSNGTKVINKGHLELFSLPNVHYAKICYERTNNTYDVDIFTEDTLRGKIGINAIESTKSLYDLVMVDSEGVEKHFAESLKKETDVAVYTKLPRGFYINTPIGHYNPD